MQMSRNLSEILLSLHEQQQYLLAKLLLISSRARPTSTQISWGQMTFYNSAISNRLMEWRTRTPEVQNTLNIWQIWFGIRRWSNLYIVTFEKTGSPLTIMLSSHIFSPNPRSNPPWECSRRADFCAQTQIRDDFESAPALPLHPPLSLPLTLRLHEETHACDARPNSDGDTMWCHNGFSHVEVFCEREEQKMHQ